MMTIRTTDEIVTLIAPVLEKYTLTAETADGKVVLRDKKKTVIGSVSIDGSVDRKKVGQQALMGALIRNDLVSVLA